MIYTTHTYLVYEGVPLTYCPRCTCNFMSLYSLIRPQLSFYSIYQMYTFKDTSRRSLLELLFTANVYKDSKFTALIIIIIIMLCCKHESPRPSPTTRLYRPSLPAGLQGYILDRHSAVVQPYLNQYITLSSRLSIPTIPYTRLSLLTQIHSRNSNKRIY